MAIKLGEGMDQSKLDHFGEVWVCTFSGPAVPLYLHVLVSHVCELHRTFGKLSVISQQGCENQHRLQTGIQQHATSRGGGKGKLNKQQQLLGNQYSCMLLGKRIEGK